MIADILSMLMILEGIARHIGLDYSFTGPGISMGKATTLSF
jgi:hypothetical protein